MTRSITDIQKAIEEARADERVARVRQNSLRDELAQAMIADAAANPHPWLGKKVKRTFNNWRKQKRTERGVLIVKEDRKYYRNCSATTGELIVVTASGNSAYRFASNNDWELAE